MALLVGLMMLGATGFHAVLLDRFEDQIVQEQSLQAMQEELAAVASGLQAQGEPGGIEGFGQVARFLRKVELLLLDLDGRVLGRTGSYRGPGGDPGIPAGLAGLLPEDGATWRRRDPGAPPLALRRVRVGTRVMVLGAWQAMGSDRPYGILVWGRILLHRSLLLYGAATIAALLVLRRTLARLHELERGVRDLARGDVVIRVDPGPPDELGRLIESFNGTAARLAVAREELARQEEARRNLLADISHELRTPVSGMLCHLEVALEGSSGIDPEIRSLIEAAEVEGRAIGARIDDLLTLARADLGELPLAIEDVNLQALLSDLGERFRKLLASSDCRLELGFVPEIQMVRGDPRRLEQVFRNLLENARAAVGPGGTIRVEVARNGDEVRVEVRDDGPGIAPEELPMIFERFQRGSHGWEAGTGLGLSIARRLVAAHGGRTEVESPPGQGACFRVVLPTG